MTKAEQFSEISNRMIFLRKSMEQMLENVTAQGFRTEDQQRPHNDKGRTV